MPQGLSAKARSLLSGVAVGIVVGILAAIAAITRPQFLERTEAIKSAVALGMPLNEIEEYLDWLDSVRNSNQTAKPRKPPRS